jgi:hypothetical protein
VSCAAAGKPNCIRAAKAMAARERVFNIVIVLFLGRRTPDFPAPMGVV